MKQALTVAAFEEEALENEEDFGSVNGRTEVPLVTVVDEVFVGVVWRVQHSPSFRRHFLFLPTCITSTTPHKHVNIAGKEGGLTWFWVLRAEKLKHGSESGVVRFSGRVV